MSAWVGATQHTSGSWLLTHIPFPGLGPACLQRPESNWLLLPLGAGILHRLRREGWSWQAIDQGSFLQMTTWPLVQTASTWRVRSKNISFVWGLGAGWAEVSGDCRVKAQFPWRPLCGPLDRKLGSRGPS